MRAHVQASTRAQPDLFGRVPQPRVALECALHIAVVDMLRRLGNPAWHWTHIASGGYRTPATAALMHRLGVVPGWPDLILLSPTGIPHFLELKRRGAKPTPEQAEFAAWCRESGVAFEMQDTFDGALDVLKRWGALRVNMRIAA